MAVHTRYGTVILVPVVVGSDGRTPRPHDLCVCVFCVHMCLVPLGCCACFACTVSPLLRIAPARAFAVYVNSSFVHRGHSVMRSAAEHGPAI